MINIIKTNKAPTVIGPYAQAVDLGHIIFISGQIPKHPQTDQIPKNISEQVHQSLENIRAILEKADLRIKNIVKTTLFIKDLNEIKIINQVYALFFNHHQASFPARSCIEVSRLPKDVKIEIEAIAVRE